MAEYRWYVAEVRFNVGNVLVLVASDDKGGSERTVQIRRRLFPLVRVCKFLHGASDGSDARDAVARPVAGSRSILFYILKIGGFLSRRHLLSESCMQRLGRHAGYRASVSCRKSQHVSESGGQKLNAVADELGRCVDLVGDAGGKLPNRLQLARAVEIGFQRSSVRNIEENAERVLDPSHLDGMDRMQYGQIPAVLTDNLLFAFTLDASNTG